MTNQNTAQVPKLRFAGFEREWEESPIQQKLKKVIDYRGKAPPKADQGVPLITARNVRDGYLDFTADEYIEASEYEAWMSRGIPVENDVLFTTEAPLGNLALFPKGGPYALGQRIITLQTAPSECDSIFLFHLLRSEVAQQQIDEKGTGSTAKGIKSKVFVQIPLHFPSVHEQQKIAAFLTAVDGRIEQLSRKKALLEEYKKGVMQQLFTQTLRFQDDHGHDFPDWEEKMLGNVVDLLSGQHLGPEDYNEDGQGVPYFTGPSDFTSDPSSFTKWTTQNTKIAKPDSVLITVKGNGVGRVMYSTLDQVALGRQLMALRSSSCDNRYLYQYLLTKAQEFIALGSGNLIPGLSRGDILTMALPCPSLSEQTKIAGFLSALDGKIGAVGEQMRQTQAWKKGLLQQMFV